MTVAPVLPADRAAPARGARLLGAPLALAGAALAATTYVGLVDPNQAGHYPTCPFLLVTGRYCPGCGSLRAVHALAHGDVAAAVGLNLLTVAGVLLLAVVWGRWTLRRWRGAPRSTVAPAWTLYLGLALVVAFWVVRNLPVGAALAP